MLVIVFSLPHLIITFDIVPVQLITSLINLEVAILPGPAKQPSLPAINYYFVGPGKNSLTCSKLLFCWSRQNSTSCYKLLFFRSRKIPFPDINSYFTGHGYRSTVEHTPNVHNRFYMVRWFLNVEKGAFYYNSLYCNTFLIS